MKQISYRALATFAALTFIPVAWATATTDATLARMLERGRDQAQAKKDAHQLLDVIGPRLTASPANLAAHEWLLETYRGMGLEAWNEAQGKYRSWRRGATHADLIAPRARTLEALAMAWSPGTKGPVEAPVVILPPLGSPAEFQKWLPTARGAFVMISPADSTCRTVEDWKAFAKPEAVERMVAERDKTYATWLAAFDKVGVKAEDLPQQLEAAGAVGLLVKNWWSFHPSTESLDAWGVSVVMDASTDNTPMVNLSCEDYGLLWRLAENGDGPRVKVAVDAEFLDEQPVQNTLARLTGSEFPEQTIVLSAHLDSWDTGSGATDNGTGTLKILEAMRLLRELYPKPRRTIVVRHWSGEEQALSTSMHVSTDMKKIGTGMQLVINQDVGTGRATALFLRGVPATGDILSKLIQQLPGEMGADLILRGPKIGSQGAEGACNGFPVVNLWPLDKATNGYTWSYTPYTWHTNRDTYDKVIFDDVQFDATLIAMLAYLVSEEPSVMPQTVAKVTDPSTGKTVELPKCTRDLEQRSKQKLRQ